MNNLTTPVDPQIAMRVKSLFESAKRYRAQRERRRQIVKVLPFEQQMELSLRAS